MAKIPDQTNDPGGRADLGPPKSRWGTTIPIVYGLARMPGIYVEAQPLREERVEDVTRGPRRYFLFGPRPTVTTVRYEYYGTFTVAFCVSAHPTTRIGNIWLNNIRIVDLGFTIFGTLGRNLEWYPGFSQHNVSINTGPGLQGPQTPGQGVFTPRGRNLPEYHGIVTLTFEDIPLADFGQSFPRVEAEIYNEGGSGIFEWPQGASVGVGAVGDGQPVWAILQDIAGRLGVPEDVIDVSDLQGADEKRVLGYIVGDSNASGLDATEPLMRTFGIDVAEGDGILEYRYRKTDGIPTNRVSQDELVRVSRDETLQEDRKAESDIPRKVTLTAIEGDVYPYEPYTVSAQRVRSPIISSEGVKTEDIRYPIVAKANDIKQWANDILNREWIERDTVKVRIPAQWLTGDVGDLLNIRLPDDTGRSGEVGFSGRVIQQEIGADLSLEVLIQSSINDFPTYTGETETIPHYGPPGRGPTDPDGPRLPDLPDIPKGLVATQFLIWDGPLIRDADDNTAALNAVQAPAYWAAGPAERRATWRGSTLLSPADNPVGGSFVPMVHGVTVNALAEPDSYWRVDRKNELHVALAAGTLESISYEDLIGVVPASVTSISPYTQRNFAILIRADGSVEYIKFQDVDPPSGARTHYILKNLLRGRRGTEVSTGAQAHAAGEKFVLLSGAVDLIALGTPAQGMSATENLLGTHTYSATSEGLAAGTEATGDLTLIRNGLKAWSPVHVNAVRQANGSVRITWTRRTRIGGDGFSDDGSTPYGDPFDKDSVVASYKLEVGGQTYSGIAAEQYDVPAAVLGGALTETAVTVRQVYGTLDGVPFSGTIPIESA